MASRLCWLSSCTNAQLSILAKAVGVNSSGTKSILTSQLLQHLPKGNFCLKGARNTLQEPCRVLSIDMGIRNLAYCCIALPHTGRRTVTAFGRPVVHEWTRIAIGEESTKTKRVTDSGPENATGKVEETGKATSSDLKEAFDPATYSQHAYDLVTALLSHLNPTHILIERQRFRSMGGSAVQEWTLRVNMFEAMIYAVLRTLSKRGFWEGDVHPIVPSKVSNFWIMGKQAALKEGPGSKSAKTKTAKIDLVKQWLEDGGHFRLEGAAAHLGEAYLRKKTRKEKRSSEKQKTLSGFKASPVAQDSVEKLDDLADCLLQGMAWIKWEENRRLIMAKGAEAIAEFEEI